MEPSRPDALPDGSRRGPQLGFEVTRALANDQGVRQGVGGASLAEGGRVSLATSASSGALAQAISAWAGHPRRRSIPGIASGWPVAPDVRRSMILARRMGGRLFQLARKEISRRAHDLVILWDVSGSMAEYVPHFLPWIQGLVQKRRRCRVFAFGTEMVEITGALRLSPVRARDYLHALRRLWGGGTAIARAIEGLAAPASKVMTSSTLLVIISDGWEAERTEWLVKALAHCRAGVGRIIWLNPLSATPGYRPVQRGIVVAQRYADHMGSGATYRELRDLGHSEA